MQAHLLFPDETPVAGKLPELQGFQKSTYFPEILYREGGDLGSKSLPAVGHKSVYTTGSEKVIGICRRTGGGWAYSAPPVVGMDGR